MLAAAMVLLAACEKDDGVASALTGGSTVSDDDSDNNSSTSASTYTDVLSGAEFDGDVATFSIAFDKTPLSETYTVDTSDEDFIETASWTRTVNITFDDAAGATVTGDDNGTVSVTGNRVTVNSPSTDKVQYVLSGTTTNGFFFIAAGGGKQCIVLNGVSITNPDGPAINNQSKKRTFVVASEGTSNFLTDGASYETDVTELIYDEDEGDYLENTYQQKGCLFSEGQLVLYGPGYLEVDANCKAGIRSDQYVRVMPTANVFIDASSGNALRGNDAVTITGGVLNLNVTGTADKGISTDGDVVINGGRTTVRTSGGYEYDTEDLDYSACAGIKADGNVTVNAGEVYLYSSGTGGKGISCDLNAAFYGGKVAVITTGSRYKNSSASVSPKGIKADGDVLLAGTHVKLRCTGGEGAEGIEAEGDATGTEGIITMQGGVVEAYTYDDALNSTGNLTVSGGYLYARATGNDGIDANANLYFNGGVTVAEGGNGAECGIDAAEGYTCYVNGGTLIAVGGNVQEVASSSKQASIVASVSSGSTIGILSGAQAILGYTMPSSNSGTALMVSSPAFSAGSSYTLRGGCTLTGGTQFYSLRTGCTVSTGSSSTDLTASTSVSGSMGGGGGIPGGGGGPGGGMHGL